MGRAPSDDVAAIGAVDLSRAESALVLRENDHLLVLPSGTQARPRREGLALDIFSGSFEFGLPRLSSSAVDLFRDEYKLPLQPPELAAVLATIGEHALPLIVLLGLESATISPR